MRGLYFLFLSIGLVIIDVLVPYLFLKGIASFWSSFLFWSLLTLAVIIFGIVYTRKWGRSR